MSVKPVLILLGRGLLRITQICVALLLALFVVLVVLLGTHQGNTFLLAAASRLEPRFSATLESGHLFGEAVLRDFHWSAAGVDLLIPQLELVLDWTCLNESTLCFERLQTQGARVSLTQTHTVEPAEKIERDGFEIPVAVEVRSLQLQQTSLTAAGKKIFLAELQLAARLDKSGLKISPLQLRDLQVDIAEQVTAAANPGSEADKVDKLKPLVLPEIELPMAVHLDGLDLKNALIRHSERDYQIHRLQLSARAAGSQVEISDFELSTPEASVQATLRIDLTADYPLTLNAQARLRKVPPLNMLATRLSATGSIAELSVELSSSSPMAGRLKAAARLLEPNLPFSARLSWQDFGWPLEKPTLHSKTGQIAIDGSLEGYSFRLTGKVRGEQIPALEVAAQGEGDLGQVKIDALQLKGLEGDAELKGTLGWRDELAWKGDFSFQGINPAGMVAELPGQLSGQLTSEFLLRDGSWALRLQQLDIGGELAGQPLRFTGDLQGNHSGDWQLSQLQLHSGENRLRLNGRIGEENTLQGELDIVDLQTSIPSASGSARGSFNLSGRRDALQLDFSLTAAALGYADQKVGAFDASGQLSFAGLPQAQVRIQARDIRYKDVAFESLRAALSGNRADHRLSIALQGEQFSSQSTLNGHLAENLWSGQLQESWLDTPIGRWILASPLALSYALDRKNFIIDKHCWSSGAASLCLNEEARLGGTGQVSASLQGISSSQIAGQLPDGLSWDGSLTATAVAGWAAGQKPSVEVELSAGEGRFEIDQAGQKLQADYQQLEARIVLDDAAAKIFLVLRSDQLGEGDISLQLAPYQEQKTLHGEIHLAGLQLDFLQPLISPLEKISGNVAADILVSGQVKQPQLSGTVTVSEGHLGGAQVLPFGIEKLNLQLNLDGYQAGLDGNLVLGDGPAELAGLLSWQQLPVTGWLTLKGERTKFNLEPELKLLISPDLRFELLPDQLALTGEVLVPYGRVKVKKLPQGAVRLSNDVVILDDPKVPQRKPALPLSLAVEVALLDDVTIDAFGLKASVEGILALRQAANQPLTGHGSIDLYGGTYRAFGQNLLINKGALLFSGPLSKPFIDVDAVRSPDSTRDNVTAGVQLRGEARNPKLSIYSEPAMSQQEAISYLLRGRSLGSSSGTSQDTMVASMLIGAGIGRSEGTISELGQVFGVDELAVDTRGEGSDTKVAVSGYLLPGVQVGYGVGLFSPVTEITLRYEILPKLVLEAVSGLQSAVDLLYEFEF